MNKVCFGREMASTKMLKLFGRELSMYIKLM